MQGGTWGYAGEQRGDRPNRRHVVVRQQRDEAGEQTVRAPRQEREDESNRESVHAERGTASLRVLAWRGESEEDRTHESQESKFPAAKMHR